MNDVEEFSKHHRQMAASMRVSLSKFESKSLVRVGYKVGEGLESVQSLMVFVYYNLIIMIHLGGYPSGNCAV